MTFSERVSAVQLMQRFVRMSRVLIPLFSNLVNKNNLSSSEQQKLDRIKTVYDNFHANPEASKHLINSDILRLIQKVYYTLVSRKGETPESFHEYDEFIRESDRLISNWDRQLMN
ncbi:MAG: hypothetical protein IPM77_11635 [Crocinitomicaceae bacterium]|nr:hypothetical protein [Crocinitomicaceae bacterium]